jgi:hypothetical protein
MLFVLFVLFWIFQPFENSEKHKKNKYIRQQPAYNIFESEFVVLILDPKIFNKSAVRLVLWWKSLNKIFIL